MSKHVHTTSDAHLLSDHTGTLEPTTYDRRESVVEALSHDAHDA